MNGRGQQEHAADYEKTAEHLILHCGGIVRDFSCKGAKTKKMHGNYRLLRLTSIIPATMIETELDVFRDVSLRLEAAGIAFMLTGSLAMNY